MTSSMTRLVIVVLCWMIVAQSRAEDIPSLVLDFLEVTNGDFDNSEQFRSSSEQFDFIQFKLVPLEIPALSPKHVIYIEKSVNHVIYRKFIAQPNEYAYQKFIYLFIFNFVDHGQNRSEPFNPKDLVSYKPEDFDNTEACYSILIPSENGSFNGDWNECSKNTRGQYQLYSIKLNCDSLILTVPAGSNEKSSLEPYKFTRTGPRYPTTFSPADYVSPCHIK